MPTLVDRRTNRTLGHFSDAECEQLAKLLEEPGFDDDGAPMPVDPQLVETMVEAGASRELVAVLEQLLQGRETFDLAIEPDPK